MSARCSAPVHQPVTNLVCCLVLSKASFAASKRHNGNSDSETNGAGLMGVVRGGDHKRAELVGNRQHWHACGIPTVCHHGMPDTTLCLFWLPPQSSHCAHHCVCAREAVLIYELVSIGNSVSVSLIWGKQKPMICRDWCYSMTPEAFQANSFIRILLEPNLYNSL